MAISHVPPASDERELLEFLDGLDSEADQATSKKRESWKRDLRLFHTGIPDTGTDHRPIFSANLLSPLLRRKAALLTESKPLLDVLPRREGLTQTAHTLKQTIAAGWDEQSVQMVLEDVALYMQLMGSCPVQITWDSEANYGLGDVALNVIDPREWRVDPRVRRCRDLDHAEYVSISHVVALWRAQRAFPKVADRLKSSGRIVPSDRDQQPTGGLGTRIIGGVESAIRRLGRAPGQTTAIPNVELREYHIADPATDEDGEALWPNGKVIVRADDVICEERANPYYDGLWPFEWLDNMPDLDSAWGRSEVDAIRRIQETFNRLGNLYVKVMTIGSVPFIITDQNALDQDAINTLRDMGYYVIEKMAGRVLTREAPPVPGGALQNFMQYSQALAENIAGLMDAGNVPAKGRVEARSSAMLEGLQQASQVLIRAQARRLESFLERLGQKWISRVFQFYTTDRLMTMIGSDGQLKSYSFERQKLTHEIFALAMGRLRDERQRRQDEEDREEAQQTGGIIALGRNVVPLPHLDSDEMLAAIKGAWRDFRFRISPFSSLSANRIARSQMLQQMAQMAYVPAWMVLEDAGFDNPKDLQNEAVQDAMRRQALGLTPGQPQGQGKKGGKKS